MYVQFKPPHPTEQHSKNVCHTQLYTTARVFRASLNGRPIDDHHSSPTIAFFHAAVPYKLAVFARCEKEMLVVGNSCRSIRDSLTFFLFFIF